MSFEPEESPETGVETETRADRACKVLLYNDEEHTYDYVVEMLSHACGLSREKAWAYFWAKVISK
jgi:ATP-dependent Clp protease adapter protein ClpS